MRLIWTMEGVRHESEDTVKKKEATSIRKVMDNGAEELAVANWKTNV